MNETKIHQKPKILVYTDAMKFVRDSYSHIKLKSPEYTVRKWAMDMGMTSPSLLIELISGHKKLQPKHSEPLANVLGLDRMERLYFENHVHQETKLVTSSEFSAHWVDSAIVEMSKIKDFEFSDINIQKTLRYPVDLDTIRERVSLLESIGLLAVDEHGKHFKCYDSITTPVDVLHLGARQSIKQLSGLIPSAVDLPHDQRELHYLSISIKRDDIHKFKSILRTCRSQIENLASDEGDSVYQTNLFFYPVTQVQDMTERINTNS